MRFESFSDLDAQVIRFEMDEMRVKHGLVIGLANGCFVVRLPIFFFSDIGLVQTPAALRRN
jgi:hypothetical protein